MSHSNLKVYMAYSDLLGDLEVIEVERNLSSGVGLYAFFPDERMVFKLLNQPKEEAEDFLSNYKELDGIFKDILHIQGDPLSMEEYAIINGVEI